ncbi:PAS domain-containing protein [Dictyobacter kobayashii]|uniref:histidine kinase n=1 Tax=Dictyobacter kobayashii TaxID=2014872 RepID=A0A402ARD9_9CHLR|nr:PAS domain-containing protein [Dictyobacter kobayashii]GCE21662.1 hypothetical protein KDK_54620 [Dictyobacter kobayashii]
MNESTHSSADTADSSEHQRSGATSDQGARLASLAQEVWDVLWLLTPDGRMQVVERWSTFTGQTATEAANYGWLTALHPDDREPFELWLQAVLRHGVRDEIECRLQQAQTAHGLMRVQLVPQFTDDGSIEAWLACGFDMSKQQQHKVFGTEHFQLAMEYGDIGFWDWDLVRNQLVWSAQCKSIFGVPISTKVSYPFLMQLLHPADRDRVNNEVAHILEHHLEYNTEFRTIWPDDQSVHWLASHGRALYDIEGKPIRLVGVVYDITDLKRVQESTNATMRQVSQLLETLPDTFVHLDKQWAYTYINSAAERVIGKPREQVLGHSFF